MEGGNIFGAKLSFSNKINQILNEHGSSKITAIRIGRRPINSMVEKAFNVITSGKWGQLRNKYYYDTLFHLFLIIKLDSGMNVSFEKNSIVTMTINDGRCSEPNTTCIDVDDYPNDSLTLNELVKQPLERIGKKAYFEYDPFNANCQIFIKAILQTFGLYDDKEANFIYQDITEIVKRLPFYTRYVAKAVTDADAFKSKLTGAGKDKPKCKMFVREKILRKESQPPDEEDPKAKDLKQLTEFMLDVIHEADEEL